MAQNMTEHFNNILSGHPMQAVFNMYNTAFGGYFLFLLYAVFRILLLIKNKNITQGWIVTGIFLSVYIGLYHNNTIYMTHNGLVIIFLVLVLEMSGTIYSIFVK